MKHMSQKNHSLLSLENNNSHSSLSTKVDETTTHHKSHNSTASFAKSKAIDTQSIKHRPDCFIDQGRNFLYSSSHALFKNNDNIIISNVAKFKSSLNNSSFCTKSYDFKSIHSYFNNVRFTDKSETSVSHNNSNADSEKQISQQRRNILTPNIIFPIILNQHENSSPRRNYKVCHKSESLDSCKSTTSSDCSFSRISHSTKRPEPKQNFSKLYSSSSVSIFSKMNDLINGRQSQQQQQQQQTVRLKIDDLSTKLTEKTEPGESLEEPQKPKEATRAGVHVGEDLSGYTQLNQYKLKDEIGKGSYGIVKLAYNKLDNKNYAMKMISKKKLMKKTNQLLVRKNSVTRSNQPFELINREIAILKKLDHENVVKLIEVLDDPNEDNLCLVFEYVEKGPIINLPSDSDSDLLSEQEAWTYFRQLTKGIEYLHFNKIIHRDIKPSNLLLTEDYLVKLVDFNISNEFDGSDAVISNSLGTPAFMPPEALKENTTSWLGKPLDIWAMGITLYSFVYGHCPFTDSCPIELRNKIQKSDVVFPDEPKTSDSFKDLILRLLTKDPLERITMCQIKEHDWITRNGSCPLISNLEDQITVTDDDINNSINKVYKLDTLILIKAMIKKRSFGNPFRASFSSMT